MNRCNSPRGRPFLTLLSCWLGLVGIGGCADFTYRRIQIGQDRAQYERAFVEYTARRAGKGVCALESDALGRTDATVLRLSEDRRVAAKFLATQTVREYGWKTETSYRLRAEVDPNLTGLASAGPLDMLRALIDEMTEVEGEKLVRDAHAWVAAGLVRFLHRWPGGAEVAPDVPRLADTLERVPAGGTARLEVDPRGVYVLEYSQSVSR